MKDDGDDEDDHPTLGLPMGASGPPRDVGEAAGLPDVPGAQNVTFSTILAPDGAPPSSLRDLS